MNARIRQFISNLAATFWLVPGLLVAAGILLAIALISVDQSGYVSVPLVKSAWLYSGGGEGARTLLGAIASSTIGVAGTVFSITIAALALAAGQMGPRLLRNFVRDRSNQVTLGILLGTFVYSLLVLRSVRTQDEGTFVPHIATSVGIFLAILCVGVLVFFIGHLAGRINVDTVIELVGDDLGEAIEAFTETDPPPPMEKPGFTAAAVTIPDSRSGYLQELDHNGLADWAAKNGTVIELFVGPGQFVFPGTAIARAEPAVAGIPEAIRNATALGARVSRMDIEYPVRQLVEIAVRALSPGINDPNTAISVLDRIGATLCNLAVRHLPAGVTVRDGKSVLLTPAPTYDGLTDSMLFMIRQNAAGSPAVLIRLVEVLTAVVGCERDPARVATLRRHVERTVEDGRRSFGNPADLADLLVRQSRFLAAANA